MVGGRLQECSLTDGKRIGKWLAKNEEIIMVMSHLFGCGLSKFTQTHECPQMSTHNICSEPADLSASHPLVIITSFR